MKWVSCPCWGTNDDENSGETAADRDPVLLVSGMGGSILHSKKKNSKSEIRVWVRLFLANLAFRQNLWSLYNPKTGNCLMIGTQRFNFYVFFFKVESFFLKKNCKSFFFFLIAYWLRNSYGVGFCSNVMILVLLHNALRHVLDSPRDYELLAYHLCA